MADDELTTSQVAARLGVHSTTVLRIPAERLPFRTSPGRHRFYRAEDVDQYAAGLAAVVPPAGLDARVEQLESDVADLKAWRSRLEDR